MKIRAIFPEQTYICPKCGIEWRMLKGDTNESIVRCMACCERFQIGAHLTKRAPDAEEAAASQSVSNTESLSTSDSVPQSAPARVA